MNVLIPNLNKYAAGFRQQIKPEERNLRCPVPGRWAATCRASAIKLKALWALPVGHPKGPRRTALGRQPIRKDVYQAYAGELLSGTVNPYEVGQTMNVDTGLWSVSYGLLRPLVWAAAIRNVDFLKAAKKKLLLRNSLKTRFD